MADEQEATGPISYLIVEFPGSRMTGEGLPILVDLVDRGLIRVLDLLFVQRETDETLRVVDLRDIDHDGTLDLTIFEGATSGLMDEDDIAEAGSVIEPGSSAAVLIYENRWAAPFVQALRRGGAQLVSAGFIPQEAIEAALDAAEASV
jgi:hypothetical protein